VIRGPRRGAAPAPPLPSFPLPNEPFARARAWASPWDDVTTPYVRKAKRDLGGDALRFMLGMAVGMFAVLVARGDAQELVRITRRLVANEILEIAGRAPSARPAEEPAPRAPVVAEPRAVEPPPPPALAPPPPIVLAQRPIPTVDVRDLPRVRRHR
jgi:hypothetical protein